MSYIEESSGAGANEAVSILSKRTIYVYQGQYLLLCLSFEAAHLKCGIYSALRKLELRILAESQPVLYPLL